VHRPFAGSALERTFKAMLTFADKPSGVLISFSLDHPPLQDLPDDVLIIRTGRVYFPDNTGGFLAYIQTEFL